MTTPGDPVQQAFEAAIQDFKSNLQNDVLFSEILKTTSVDQVYDATDKLQREQAKQGHLRHLSKIQPYLEGLNAYVGVIEVFMQAKPDVLALIWGPLKLIIQWASSLKQSFDAIIDTTAEIGLLLPEFREVAKLFGKNSQIKEIMILFFKDMLDFYLIALKFFSLSRSKYFFESLWPRHRSKIKVVEGHINRLKLLLRNEVRLEHIQEEHAARQLALEHFDRTERHHRRQDYESIKADISPKTYEDKYYYLQGRFCQGTEKWLIREATFVKWLNMSDTTTKLLWLQGIPGAGKTYLSSAVLDRTRGCGRTIFAFLSYTVSTTTALSILHSMIFQLVSGSDDLQAVLCQSNREELKFSIDKAVHLLTTLLSCAGPIYIVIDGVDEIEEVERGRLMSQILSLSKTCDHTKILISSRVEEDIAKRLDDVAAKIRVDHCNAGSIQAFIKEYTQTWYQARGFPPETQAELQGLLAPLAANSKGMFLYTKIVLSNIEYLEVSEIRDELQILPESLDDAYGRILARVNSLNPPKLREKARRLLGWIGTTHKALTVQELEQALVISPDDTEWNAKVQGNLNIARICGPIVEVIDGYVHFVHFTVKEYLFCPQIKGFIDGTEATLSLVMCCLTYLCQQHHDPDILDESIIRNLLNGTYRFHDFATTMWFGLVERFARSSQTSNSPPDELIRLLRSLMIERQNENWNGSQSDSLHPSFRSFELHCPEVHQFLRGVATFLRTCSNSDFNKNQGTKWTYLDPLTISDTSVRIYNQLDTLSCTKQAHEKLCSCSTLRMHYGRRYFKCGFLGCPSRRYGFETQSDRNSHMKHHDKPWKCSFPNCEFAEGGFLSRKMRDDHLTCGHLDEAHVNNISIGELDADDIQPLIFDIIKTNNLGVFKVLVQQFTKLPTDIKIEACKVAASAGSLSILEMMLPDDILIKRHGIVDYRALKQLFTDMVNYTIQGGSIETFRYILSHFTTDIRFRYYGHISQALPAVLKSDSDAIFEEWESHVDSSEKKPSRDKRPHEFNFMTENIIKATARQPNREELLLSFWKKLDLQNSCGKGYLGITLASVASTTCSINLATYLLDCGADVDHRITSKHKTPLHHAARQDSAAAAEFMKFLLLKGAKPNNSAGGHRTCGYKKKGISATIEIRAEIGAKNISKWLNVSWDELIAEVEEERQRPKPDI